MFKHAYTWYQYDNEMLSDTWDKICNNEQLNCSEFDNMKKFIYSKTSSFTYAKTYKNDFNLIVNKFIETYKK